MAPEQTEQTVHIEQAVRERRVREVMKAIPLFLRRRAGDPDALFQACDWYRRLGLHEQGYRLVALGKAPRARVRAGLHEGQRLLWCARFLNLMGATELAIPLLRLLALESFDDYRIAGSIHLARFEFDEAVSCLARMRALDPEPERYISRLSLVNLADAHCGRGEHALAIELVQDVLKRSSESLLQGIGLQAWGEYEARRGRFKQARAVLEKAAAHFKPNDTSPDYGLLLKWLAYAQARVGQREEAAARFKKAFELLRAARLRPEAWLDVVRLRGEVGDLSVRERNELAGYPGLAAGFRSTLPTLASVAPPSRLPLKKYRLILCPTRNEYAENGRLTFGIPRELQALAALVSAGRWGLPVVRLKSLLWPGEYFAFLQLEGRLQQLFHRLRSRHRLEVSIVNGVARLAPGQAKQIKLINHADSSPIFLRTATTFSRAALDAHYGLSRTQGWTLLKSWIDRGWVQAVPNGNRTVYTRI